MNDTSKLMNHEKNNPKRSRYVKLTILFLILLPIFLLARPSWHILITHYKDVSDRETVPAGYIDDASAMNLTAVAGIWQVPAERELAEQQLKQLLQRAKASDLKVSIAGTRHSMGGHSIAPDGIVVDMLSFREMDFDEKTKILNVQSGAIWHDVIEYLDEFDRSVAIMQSNDSFSVGGSLSVNCHGWQFGKPPIASTVNSFRLMQVDGEIIRCSRVENEDFFQLVLGGYGLFGIILDVDLQTVPNRRYKVDRFVVPAIDALTTFDDRVSERENVEMVYARMDISDENFLNEALIYILSHDPLEDGSLPEVKEKGLVGLRRSIFRGSVDSDYGKRLRWKAETDLQATVSASHFSRNQLLSEGVETFANRSEQTTDILHEYFVPREGVPGFVQDLQTIIPEYDNDLLNVTIRSVEEDEDTFLRYADKQLFSFVMLFNHARTEDADDEMREMTEDLIAAALMRNGRYYLPYRLHASATQFHQAYPQAREFFALKRKYDPQELFVNKFYLKYGSN
ncbi:MAG: FAD-binding oxidoreductase [Planctomicrobium sp.]|jgi:FAD/FMN-containing dehydrogenase|nr:FAD-binding oxidoreductase [Planctomicrobium sp.]